MLVLVHFKDTAQNLHFRDQTVDTHYWLRSILASSPTPPIPAPTQPVQTIPTSTAPLKMHSEHIRRGQMLKTRGF